MPSVNNINPGHNHTTNLSSNNPFRRHRPELSSSRQSPFADPTDEAPRPTSKNPFLHQSGEAQSLHNKPQQPATEERFHTMSHPNKPSSHVGKTSSAQDTMPPQNKPPASSEGRLDGSRRPRRANSEGLRLKPNRKCDAIDVLDESVNGIPGVFHHDGPYDALNPHRNRKGSSRAPMKAFPEGSLNNTLGGSGPVNVRPDHAAFMGHGGAEAFKEYGQHNQDGQSSPTSTPVFDPLSRGSVVMGDDTMGLGPSTFLEGTPASKTAIHQNQIFAQQETMKLEVKRQKSVTHRVKQQFTRSGRGTNELDGMGEQPLVRKSTGGSISRPRRPMTDGLAEGQPSVGTLSSIAPDPTATSGDGRRSFSALDSSATMADGQQVPGDGQKGLLARVKSLRGGRKP